MIEQSVVIQRPLFDVFDYLMDVDRFWEWAPYFLNTHVVNTDENDWPTLFKARVGLSWDLSIMSKVWISNVQRGKSITFRSEEPPQVATYTVEPTLSGTILTARHNPWPIFGMSSLQAPINLFMADYLNQALSNVKQTLEARPPTSRPIVFLSYRQQSKAEYSAGRIVDALSREFGDGSIFRDLATISAGQDANKAIEQGLQGCSAVIVLIHDQWLEAFKEKRERDYVLSEIKAAIAAEKAVIPVTLKGVSIEEVQQQLRQDQELKEILKEISAPLSEKQWQQLRDDPDFTSDIRRIIQSIWAAVIKGGKWERVIKGGRSQDSKTPRPDPALSEPSWAQASEPSWAQLLSNFVTGWTQAVSIVVNRSRSGSRSTGDADSLP
jgi:hypothetical protein